MAAKNAKNGSRTALIAGASGMTGRHVLSGLLADSHWDNIVAVVRSPLEIKHDKLTEIQVDPENLDELNLPSVDDVFICVGTTLRNAGSRKAFRKVDHDYVRALAIKAQTSGATRIMLVSAVGASPMSGVFYSRVKGEAERSIRAIGFETVHIFRPSLLLGNRDEFRPLEAMFQQTAPLFNTFLWGPMSSYKALEAETLANAMIGAAKSEVHGDHIHEHDHIQNLAAA